MIHEKYMRMALELAKKGCGFVNPNPMVGAVIVKDDRVIGQGWHKEYGKWHAERRAILDCREDMTGATLYVNLEPCCHYGKTMPCTEIIIKSGIKKVVCGTLDPNPLVDGKGIELLRKYDIEVVVGVLEKECVRFNEVYFHYIQTGLPFVIMKYALTMDGKTATSTGESRWITDDVARRHAHELRSAYMAIMVGIGTVLKDNPLLSSRIENGHNPVRIICDTDLRIQEECQIVKSAGEIQTIIATASHDLIKRRSLSEKGCEVITIPRKDGKLDLEVLIQKLGEKRIDSILLEGGNTMNWSAVHLNLVDKVCAYVAPKIFGGDTSPGAVGGRGVDAPMNGIDLRMREFQKVGDSIFIESDVVKNVYRNS